MIRRNSAPVVAAASWSAVAEMQGHPCIGDTAVAPRRVDHSNGVLSHGANEADLPAGKLLGT